MCPAPAPAEETPNPYEAYYLEQAAMLSVPDQPAASRGLRRDLESFRLAPLAGHDEQRPRLRGREIVTVILGVVILVVIPLIIGALYWRSSTTGN